MSHVVVLVRARKTILLLASVVTAVGLALLGMAAPAGAAPAAEEGKILFASPNGLQTMNPDGSGRSFFSPPISNAISPEWSSDGTKFVYVDQDTDRIVVASADGVERTPLPKNVEGGRVGYPTLSPDGTRVAFVIGSDDGSDIYTMNLDGSDLAQLDSDVPPGPPGTVSTTFTDLDWSPNGEKIVLTRQDTVSDSSGLYEVQEIYTVDADGTGQPTGFADPVYGIEPAWSPDGSEISFRGAPDDLYIMNADGTGQSRLTTDGRAIIEFNHAWSPKGTRLVFSGLWVPPNSFGQDFDLFTINVDGTHQTNVTNTTNDFELYPSWQPVFPDTTSPEVDGVTPADGAQRVARGSKVTANFSEAVQEATLTSNVQLFSGKSTRPIKATLSWDPSTNPTSVTLTPASKLDAKTRYTAKIKGGSTGVKDLAGNPLASDYSWSFTTGSM